MVVPIFGQKWFLLTGFWYLWAGSRVTSGSGFFAETALLKPAHMLQSAEW